MTDRTYNVRELMERYSVSEHTVLAWIRNGLRAIDVSRSRGKKPRWRIRQEDLDSWELLRTPTPTPPKSKARRRRDESVTQYF